MRSLPLRVDDRTLVIFASDNGAGGGQENNWEQPAGKKLAQAVRLADWKGYRADAGGRVELYDLGTDPAETNDVAPEHPDVA